MKFLFILTALIATYALPSEAQDIPRRPVSTYSIVARDSITGQLGVAVQSHWFSVGPIVPWAEPSVGAVATQSLVDPAYGPLGLELMRMGRTASEALQALVSTDKSIVGPQNTGKPWADRLFDLRVEDHPNPVQELRRLVTLQRAYLKLNEGDLWLEKKDIAKALEAYREATTIVPDKATNGEAAFWVGVTLADTGNPDDAILYLARAYKQDKRWAELLPRLPVSGLLPDNPDLIKRLVADMKKSTP